VIVPVKWKGYEKLTFFDQCLALFRKRYKIRPQLQWKTYVIRVIRAHGLSAAALQEVFRVVVIAKLLCAASALVGFRVGQ